MPDIWSATAKALLQARFEALKQIKALGAQIAAAEDTRQSAKNVLFFAQHKLDELQSQRDGLHKEVAELEASYKTFTGSDAGRLDV